MTKVELEAVIKPSQIITDYVYIDNGKDSNGFTTYKIVYIEPPENYKLIHLDKDSKLAVLEDLDYVEPEE